MTEKDSDDVPDSELVEPNVETNTDENAEPEKNSGERGGEETAAGVGRVT